MMEGMYNHCMSGYATIRTEVGRLPPLALDLVALKANRFHIVLIDLPPLPPEGFVRSGEESLKSTPFCLPV